jgi:hypothetical protein
MSDLTPDEFLKDFTKNTDGKILLGLLVILGVLLIGWVGDSIYKDTKQNDDLIKRELNGILISSKDITHGIYSLVIKQHMTGEEIKYDLSVSKFFRDNNIHEGDSISKTADSHVISFFKKKEKTYYKCCELYWY